MQNLTPNPEAYPRLRLILEEQWAHRRFFRSRLRWRWILGFALLLLIIVITGLPFILPLDGPKIISPAALADPNGNFIDIEGDNLYYVHAAGDGDTVILLHGFGGSTVSWVETIPALADAGYDVYAVDQLGFGLSDKGGDGDYSPSAQVDRVIQFMDALHIEQAVVVGHSTGGAVAARIALSHPDRVTKLVLVDAAILTENRLSVPDVLLKLPFVRRWAQIGLRRVLVPMTGDMLRDAVYDDTIITPELEAAYKRLFQTPGWDVGLLAIVRDQVPNRLPLDTIQAPTLILWGKEDTWISPDDAARLEELIPDAQRMMFDKVGHLPMHEVPETFNEALITFLG
jgi:pimeloyl-ACP methyl ester carboxylesterase